MEKFFVLVQIGCCDMKYVQRTAEELSIEPMIVSIAAADNKLAKSIAVGDIKITRPKRSSAEGNISIEINGVEIVSYNVIRYHQKKAVKYLKSLRESLQMDNLTGKCGVNFFISEWDELVEKYT